MRKSVLIEAEMAGTINSERLRNMSAEELSKAKIPVAARVCHSEAYIISQHSDSPAIKSGESL